MPALIEAYQNNIKAHGKMKSRSLLSLCLLLPVACGGESATATTARRGREAQHTQNEDDDMRRRRMVSDLLGRRTYQMSRGGRWTGEDRQCFV